MVLRDTNIRGALRDRQRGFLLNPFRFGGGGGPTDPNFASVQLLLSMDGGNGSTTFTDTSSFARSPTAVINYNQTTANFQFGVSSGVVTTTPGAIYYEGANGFTIGTQDLTIEAWVRRNAAGGDIFGWGAASNNNEFAVRTQFDTLRFITGTTTRINTGYVIPLNTFEHIALVREAGIFRLYANGALRTGSYNLNTDLGAVRFTVGGSYNGSTLFSGPHNLDEVRVTVGVARYSGATYTVPTAPFPTS
jgi:hypothetical protein